MEKKQKIIILLVILIIIFTAIGSSLAYLSWISSEEQKTQITFTATAGVSCSADVGGDITSSDARMIPTEVNDTTVGNYIKRTVLVKPTITETGKIIYMDLWLDINNLGTGLSNSVNFRYAFTTSGDSPTTGVVVSGNFNRKTAGDKINLLTENQYTATATETYYLWIWLDAEETSAETMNQSFSLSLNGSCYDHISITANSLINNANPSTLMYADATDSQKGEMWTFAHDATIQTSATTDYRYIGSSPNNYITFNDEVWRIIGVFDGRIKIIRNDTLGKMFWDYKKSGVGSSTTGSGSNDWTDSQLMYMLNPTSYTLKTGYSLIDGKIYDGNSNIIYQLGCKPANIASGATSYSCINNTWNLNSTALSQIGEATYYLGGSSSSSGQSASSYYAFERGTPVYSGRSTSWTGLVGLMYPSDYAYTFANGVDDKCYTDTYNCNSGTPSSSWLYKSGTVQWTVSPYSGYAYSVFAVDSTGLVGHTFASNSLGGVCPVAYLRSDIKLQGTGASDDPYEIIG